MSSQSTAGSCAVSSATPVWEQSKENAAPLERGRNVASLNRRFGGQPVGALSSAMSENDVRQKMEEYEKTVRPSEAPHVTDVEDGEDPLAHWLVYIKYYQETFPADTNQQFLLTERCVRALVKMKHYSNDDRFIGVCAKYADKTKDPGQVFKYLHHQKVGACTALFWIAWAFVAEKDNDFPFAEKIFKKGISKNAQPLQMLKLRHQQFQRRMSRHWLNSSTTNGEEMNMDEYDDGSGGPSRATLGRISREKLRRNDRSAGSGRPGGPRRHLAGSVSGGATARGSGGNGSGTGSFSILVEPVGENGHHNLDQSYCENDEYVLAPNAEQKKENSQDPERWNQSGGLEVSIQRKRHRSRGPPPAFPVFVDEECAIENERKKEEHRHHSEHQRRVRDDRAFRERGEDAMVSEH